MHKDESNTMAWALLVLSGLALVGMLVGSWELLLYTTVVTFSVLLAMSVAGSPRAGVAVPVGVTVALLALFGLLHSMGLASPTGEGSFLGWDPMTAIYLFAIGPVYLAVSLAYALHDRATATDEEIAR
jgi:hypothetical protein